MMKVLRIQDREATADLEEIFVQRQLGDRAVAVWWVSAMYLEFGSGWRLGEDESRWLVSVFGYPKLKYSYAQVCSGIALRCS
jgi:hypothetical protein